jgi:hypothetical protein
VHNRLADENAEVELVDKMLREQSERLEKLQAELCPIRMLHEMNGRIDHSRLVDDLNGAKEQESSGCAV